MNEFDRLNPKLAAWLDAMPNEAPDRVSDGIMSGIATVKQQRAPLLPWTVTIVRPPWLVPVVIAILLLIAMAAAVIVGSRLPSHRLYTNDLVPAVPLTAARSNPVLVSLTDGRVLVVGGSDVAPAAELYDLSTKSSSALADVTDGAGLRHAYLGARLQDGRAFLLAPGEAWVFDPRSSAFTRLPQMTAARIDAAVAVLADGQVLVTGGYTADDPGNSLATAEIFDPKINQFTPTGAMGWARQEHDMIALPPPGGGAIALGGVTKIDGGQHPNSYVERFDEKLFTFHQLYGWSGVRVLPVPIPDGRIALFDRVQPFTPAGSVVLYDVDADSVGGIQPLPYAVSVALPLDDGRAFLAGGEDHGRWAAMYDPLTKVLTVAPTLLGWSPSAAVLSDGRVLLAGGFAAPEPADAAAPIPPPVDTVELFQ
jgi:hypothetical protein